MTNEQFLDWQTKWQAAASKALERPITIDDSEQSRLSFIYEHSPYLSGLLVRHPDIFLKFHRDGADHCWQHLTRELDMPYHQFSSIDALSKHLRYIKQRTALLTALADLFDEWKLSNITFALSHIAETSIEKSLEFLLASAASKGEITLTHEDKPTMDSGIIVLGMGKLGGYELNYSSDIDLILFYESGKLHYQGRHNEQYFLNKLAQGLVSLMQERTADGYVFRMDLRLRPDPASTPPIISTDAAMQYYENLGQNWERAAMIKARAVAGDMEASERLLADLKPYVWRKNLDFASIQDILSIKRQISKKVGVQEELAGHNIKLGKGGIREIEFFVQLHQLIWGGRQKELRGRETVATLYTLEELKHVSHVDIAFLVEAYEFYRKLEHRLQMVDDQQTHTMPERGEGYNHIASFMGYESTEAFEAVLGNYIELTHNMFTDSFGGESLYAEGNLVFTGTNHDPETLGTLSKMGFQNGEVISQTIMGWHRGSRRCTRSKLARQLLTELVPDILIALSNTVHPDQAFLKFDAFLTELPVGIQLFSLISQNPHLLSLIADVMGTSPSLSKILSRRPQLVETALFNDFYESLPSKTALKDELAKELELLEYYDAAMERLRQFKNEKQFQAGIQLLRNFTNADLVGAYLSDLADVLIESALDLTFKEFAAQHGALEYGSYCIIALGKLGSRELTFNSDLDLMFVYDCPEDTTSDGERSHSPSVYYNRLCQRIVNALTAVGRNGALYEVDTRLRPSGEQGLLAVSKDTLTQYFSKDAWTFERMALCKARAIAGDSPFKEKVGEQIYDILAEGRGKEQLRNDIIAMRERVETEYGTSNIWDVKHIQGGLMDIDFAAEYILLAAAKDFPELSQRRSRDILYKAANNSDVLEYFDISEDMLNALIDSSRFLIRLQHMLRLTSEDEIVLNYPPAGLAEALSKYMGVDDYEALIKELKRVEKRTFDTYMKVMQISH